MDDATVHEQAAPEVAHRIRESFERQGLMRLLGARLDHIGPGRLEYKINLVAPADGDHLEAVGTVRRSGRTLTVCQLDVYGVSDAQRTLVATGQQTLIRVQPSSEVGHP